MHKCVYIVDVGHEQESLRCWDCNGWKPFVSPSPSTTNDTWGSCKVTARTIRDFRQGSRQYTTKKNTNMTITIITVTVASDAPHRTPKTLRNQSMSAESILFCPALPASSFRKSKVFRLLFNHFKLLMDYHCYKNGKKACLVSGQTANGTSDQSTHALIL